MLRLPVEQVMPPLVPVAPPTQQLGILLQQLAAHHQLTGKQTCLAVTRLLSSLRHHSAVLPLHDIL